MSQTDDDVIDDETKLTAGEKHFLSTLAREKLLESLSFDELIEEVKSRYKTLLRGIVEEADSGIAVSSVNPSHAYQSQEQRNE